MVAFTAAQIPGIAGRVYPPSLAGPLYPEGIPIYDEAELPRLIKEKKIQLVVFAYSDVTHEEVMHKASLAMSLGADFMLLGPQSTMLTSSKKVVAVTATKTGAGKSTVSRYVVRLLRQAGVNTVVVRHPMPYGVLERQVVQRFERLEDMDRYDCTVEEREEFEPHLREGTVVYAGVDYEAVLKAAEQEADVILWDGGNNDLPFFKPDLHITVVDATRPGLETSTYPGEINLLLADVMVVNKTDRAAPENVDKLVSKLSTINPKAIIAKIASRIHVEKMQELKGLRVCVVEDAPSLTHGGMAYGAAYEAAVSAGAVVVDPKPYSTGIIRDIYVQYPHIGPVVPAMGYTSEQLKDLEKTLAYVDCDAILSSSPTDLSKLIKVGKPFYRVWFEACEAGRPLLREALRMFSFPV
ncbi:MAG: GTP-binding protein [Candidatus Caldarchaeum sp.]